MSRPPDADESDALARRGTLGLGLLFGTMYFVQGIAEPTEGLIAQPVRSLLKSWGHGAGQIAAFAAVLALPWSLKPLYGLISDFVPLAGYRRKSYLLATSAVTVIGLVLLGTLQLAPGATGVLLALLLVPTVGVAFSDVVVDALMVEKGQPRGITGQLQSIQWASMYTATIGVGVLGGWLSDGGRQTWGFAICAAVTLLTFVLAWRVVDEERVATPPHRLRTAAAALWRTARNPPILAVAAFLFLWNFNPFSSSVLYVHLTREMGLSEQFYGNLISLDAAAAIVASVAYGLYCRRVPFGVLVHVSIITGILATVAYWLLAGCATAVAVTLLVGLTYMTACLVQFDLAARVCPPETAGTVFALLMATTNLSNSLSTAVGGYLYELGLARWGSRWSFNVLVALGALLTAGCWLLVPTLQRYAIGSGPSATRPREVS